MESIKEMASVWDKYRKSKVHKIDLSPIGLDGYSVTVRQMRSFTPAEIAAFEGLSENMSTDEMGNILAEIVVSWDIPDPRDESKILASPKEDPAVIKLVPVEIYSYINTKIAELESSTVPPQSGT